MPKDVETLAELIEIGIELQGIRFTKLAANSSDADYGDDFPSVVKVPAMEVKIKMNYTQILFQLTIDLNETTGLGVVVSVETFYKMEKECVPSNSTVLDFAQKIALMSAYPYMREAVADLTQKVFGKALTLPLITPNSVELSF